MAVSEFFSQIFDQTASGDTLKDYQHASRTFVDSLYRLSPKFSNLFHVFVEFDNEIVQHDTIANIELGLMAKAVVLPKFSIQTKTYNAYNRKNVAQERINYDPIQITFHDDSADVVRDFWYGYYAYYYRDSDNTENTYHQDHKYKSRNPLTSQSWGYTPVGDKTQYIKSIRIYSLHQKSFSSYILLNPTITGFQHGQHTAGNYESMEHQMTLAYEGVLYQNGPVSNGTVQGFNQVHYDNTASPLTPVGAGTTSLFGQGGLTDTGESIVKNLQDGNFAAAALSARHAYTNFKNVSFKDVATGELSSLGVSILKGQNTQAKIFVPTVSSISEGLAKASPAINKATGSIVPNMNSGRIDL